MLYRMLSLRIAESVLSLMSASAVTDKYDKDNTISFQHGSDDYYEALSWLMWQMGTASKYGVTDGADSRLRRSEQADSVLCKGRRITLGLLPRSTPNTAYVAILRRRSASWVP